MVFVPSRFVVEASVLRLPRSSFVVRRSSLVRARVVVCRPSSRVLPSLLFRVTALAVKVWIHLTIHEPEKRVGTRENFDVSTPLEFWVSFPCAFPRREVVRATRATRRFFYTSKPLLLGVFGFFEVHGRGVTRRRGDEDGFALGWFGVFFHILLLFFFFFFFFVTERSAVDSEGA